MVVYELKDPVLYPSERPKPLRKDVQPLVPADTVRVLDSLVLKREWERNKQQKKRQERHALDGHAEKRLRTLLNQVNENLTTSGVQIHLVLNKDENGFALDVYDCSDQKTCSRVLDIIIDISELPTLLGRLEKESGIILDTVL